MNLRGQLNLGGRSDDDLLSDVRGLIGSQRELTAKLVAYLAEIEERRLHVIAGFSSMFEFCVKSLRLSEGEAFRRLAAARLGRRFPVVYSLIASGDVHLSALALLRPHVTEENHAELLDGIRKKSKREVDAFLAERFPQHDQPARIRHVAPERFRIEFTASAELREKLERCLDLSSHVNPRRDLSVVVERAVELLLAKLERERLGRVRRVRRETPTRPSEIARASDDIVVVPRIEAARTADPTVRAGRVPRATRRHVFERDGAHCTYVSPTGDRCDATAFLELDHIVPLAAGGGNEAGNLRVRCRAHNRLWAEQAFGRAHVERALDLRRKKRGASTPKNREGSAKAA